ncbi:hypothetical protein MIMGU_mgv1a016974mg [Erythranthe guttata]|uniref:Uncharacterized protein n=1 Tax=Erythranthe guttata TaxID=4155 RepID=A0A022S0U4_ERYGU|nr:hypothetical protein MIMGU_mgv1a016974mg [Erythranthe guttata]
MKRKKEVRASIAALKFHPTYKKNPIPNLFRVAKIYLGEPPSKLACCSSRSLNCCSRSISIISGTMSTRKVVPTIQAAFPVLFRSFFATKAVSDAAFLPR